MTAEAEFGLTDDQHRAIGRLVVAARASQRPQAGVLAKAKRTRRAARVMIVNSSFPVYSPKHSRYVALFDWNPTAYVKTVSFVGQNLEGDILLTIDGTTTQIDCRTSTNGLRAAIGLPLRQCRATAFPGYWEFVFPGRWKPEVSAVPFEPANSDDVFFQGGLWVVEEGWVSSMVDGISYTTVAAIDGIPFVEGEVRRGALAIASPLTDSLWIAGKWCCPAFSFK